MWKACIVLLLCAASAETSGVVGNRSLLSKRAQQIQCSSQISNTRCSGDELKDLTGVSDAEACCKSCQATSGCNAWSWKTNKKCIIMESCDERESQEGSISGISDAPGPSPAPPAPPGPSPKPPSPGPGGLPDIPDVKIWVGFWGTEENSKEAYEVSSVVFDDPPKKDIEKYGGGGVRFLYPAFKFFCKEDDAETGKCKLYDDYEDRWNDAVPKMTKLLKDEKIIGFSVGDERVCGNGKHGTSVSDWEKIINTIRASFPDRSKALIHANECGSTFGDAEDGGCKNDDFVKQVPAGLDWISIDKYRHDDKDDDKPGFIQKVQDYYKACVYPKMQSNQKACIVPGSSQVKDSTMLQDAKDTVKWAESDGRIGCITAYRWDDMTESSKYKDTKKFWSDYASKTRPGMRNTTFV